MSILKYSDLTRYRDGKYVIRLEELRKSASAEAKPTVFLSHRHDDKDWVIPVKAFLNELGAAVYIDSLDPEAPRETSPETAALIKTRIDQCHKFIVLASPGSINSRWIPWELGYADSKKGLPKVAVLPIGNSDSDWAAREYFGLYQTIKKGNSGGFGVFPPNGSQGVPLKAWLGP